VAVNKRNDPCSCGSGKKYKQCCARSERARDSQWMIYGVGGLLAVGLVWGLGSAIVDSSSPAEPPATPAGKVWNEEHGHFHDASLLPTPGSAPTGGQVWSEEHGHFHDANGSPGSDSGVAEPAPVENSADLAPTSDPG
jgi:hypothetical protein